MVRISARQGSAVLGAGLIGLAMSGAAHAQPPSEAAEINRCLCMQQQISQLSAEMSAKMAALRRTDQKLAELNAQLRRERPVLDVNDPAAVEHFKVLLEERDATRKDSVGPVWTAANDAVALYNARVGEYNGSCSRRLFDPVLMRQIQATLTCQAPGYGPPPGPAESEYPPAPAYTSPGPPASEYPPPAAYPPPSPPESGYPPASAYPPSSPPASEYPPASAYPPSSPPESGYPPAPGYSPPSPPETGYPPYPPPR